MYQSVIGSLEAMKIKSVSLEEFNAGTTWNWRQILRNRVHWVPQACNPQAIISTYTWHCCVNFCQLGHFLVNFFGRKKKYHLFAKLLLWNLPWFRWVVNYWVFLYSIISICITSLTKKKNLYHKLTGFSYCWLLSSVDENDRCHKTTSLNVDMVIMQGSLV